MITIDELERGVTLGERSGVTEEIGRAVAAVASAEMTEGHLETAREILEGLAVSNPYDPATWAMLAVLDRRRGKLLSARVCAETAFRLAPADLQVRLVRAEVMLCLPDLRARAAAELRRLADEGSGGAGEGEEPAATEVAARARALLTALGEE